MTTRDEAREIVRGKLSQFEPRRSRRTVYLGDGRGTTASNMWVPNQPRYVYARESPTDDRYFPIRNTRIKPRFNLPVIAGYLPYDPEVEQIIAVDPDADAYISGGGGGSIVSLGPHASQHQFGGGDEVYIDPKLFLEGLIKPTNPPSASVKVESFTYYYDQWDRYPGSTITGFTEYVPSGSNTRYVLIAFDPFQRKVVARPGNIISGTPAPQEAAVGQVSGSTTWDGWEGYVPSPAGDEYPLGALRLDASITSFDWFDSQGSQVIFNTRLFIQPPWKRVLDRLSGIEGHLGLGASQSLPTTGVAQTMADHFRANAGQLQDIRISNDPPTDTQVLTYSSDTHSWTPSDQSSIGGGGGSPGINIGGASEIYNGIQGGSLSFRTLRAGSGIEIQQNASVLEIKDRERSITGTFMGYGTYPTGGASLAFPFWQGPRNGQAIIRKANISIQGSSTVAGTASAWVGLDKRSTNGINDDGVKLTSSSKLTSIGTDVSWTTFSNSSILNEQWVCMLASGIAIDNTRFITTTLYYEVQDTPITGALLYEHGASIAFESACKLLLENV